MPTIEQVIAAQLPALIAFGTIIIFAMVEIALPRMSNRPKWQEHLPPILIFAIMTVATTLLLQFVVQNWIFVVFVPLKLLHISQLPWPAPIVFAFSFLAVDFFSYLLHRLSHAIPILWRMHAIHHSDEHVTAVTAQLHHPLEVVANYVILLSR